MTSTTEKYLREFVTPFCRITDRNRGGMAVPDTGLVIKTSIPEVELQELTVRNALEFFQLVTQNRDHLTQFGDYQDLAQSTLEEIEAYFSNPADVNIRMGIWRGSELMGRVDLHPVEPRAYVLGYWIGSEYSGNGYVTASCRAMIDYGREQLGATDFWAGVTHGNERSIAVLERLGFRRVERLEGHTRFHLQTEKGKHCDVYLQMYGTDGLLEIGN